MRCKTLLSFFAFLGFGFDNVDKTLSEARAPFFSFDITISVSSPSSSPAYFILINQCLLFFLLCPASQAARDPCRKRGPIGYSSHM